MSLLRTILLIFSCSSALGFGSIALAQTKTAGDFERNFAANKPSKEAIAAELSADFQNCDLSTRQTAEACIAIEFDRHMRAMVDMIGSLPRDSRESMNEAQERWKRELVRECRDNSPDGKFNPWCVSEMGAERVAWLRSVMASQEVRQGATIPADAMPSGALGSWTIARVLPQSGITSSHYRDAQEMVGKTVKIDSGSVTIDGKRCLIDSAGGELLRDNEFTHSKHYNHDWGAFGFRSEQNMLGRGYPAKFIYSYCPGTETITPEQRANVDMSMVDEYERHLLFVDTHMIYFGEDGGPIIMSLPDAWVELRKE